MIGPNESYFRSAILDENGDVDVAYYALAWGMRGWIVSCAAVLVVGAWSVWRTSADAGAIITAMGVAIGAVSGGFATMLAATGAFLWGDNRPAAAGSTTTTERKTTTTAGDAAPMPVEIVNHEPVPVVETQRGFALGLVLQLIAAASVVGLIGVGVWKLQHWENAAFDKEHARAEAISAAWELDKAARIKRTTELTLLLSGKLQTAMSTAAQQEGKTNVTFSTIRDQVARIPAGVRVALPAPVARVLSSAGSAANITRPDARTEASPAAIPDTAGSVVYDQRELAVYLEAGPRAYADAYNLWAACRAREDSYLLTMMEAAQ